MESTRLHEEPIGRANLSTPIPTACVHLRGSPHEESGIPPPRGSDMADRIHNFRRGIPKSFNCRHPAVLILRGTPETLGTMKRATAAALVISSVVLSGWVPVSVTALQGRLAIIQPVFTSTAYHEYYEHATPDSSSQGWGSFYIFYASNYHQTGNITQDLWMLSLPVSSGLSYFGGWGQDAGLPGLVNGSGLPSRDISILTDMEVDEGALFGPHGIMLYSAVVLGHEEYVTAREYSAFQEFVRRGGRLIEMSGNAFYGEVNYSASSGTETFWRGHGFEYDGVTAWVSGIHHSRRPTRTGSGATIMEGPEGWKATR